MAELRDRKYQNNRLLFRNNIMRIGEFEAFEISKCLKLRSKESDYALRRGKRQCPDRQHCACHHFSSRTTLSPRISECV